MEYRTLGKTNTKVPVVSFGSWAIGGWQWGGTDDDQARRAIQRGIDLGVTCIDTAPVYGFGHSETIVGEAIQGKRDKLVIATKCGLRWDTEEGEFFFDTVDRNGNPLKLYRNLRPDSIRKECENSLRRLKIDVIDLYQCHWPDKTTQLEDTMDALLTLQKEGKIRYIGVSNFTIEMMETCLRKGRIESAQPKYNALERDIESELLPFCRENQISVLAYSPIAQGLLTGKVTLDREFPHGDLRRDNAMFSPVNRRRILNMLDRVKPIAEGYGITLGQLFIAWTVHQPGITTALVGARNEKQIEENARAGSVRLTDKDLHDIRAAIKEMEPLQL
ncbi:MAG TPA: aldo/keto reductase [Candidatus Hydrogenedens sp.]|nr:aldo/keto reductase [Candidatus Hydrogenedens sp.]